MGRVVAVRNDAAHAGLLRELADDMRPADQLEVWLSGQHTPIEALRSSIDRSRWSMVLFGKRDRPVCAFGLGGRVLAQTASPWMLGTPRVQENRTLVAQVSKNAIREMRRGVKTLENWVHADNVDSIRWLEWLGFQLEAPAPHGKCGALFRRFTMEGDS